MIECLGPDGDFANASAVEPCVRAPRRARIEQARAEVAALVGADSRPGRLDVRRDRGQQPRVPRRRALQPRTVAAHRHRRAPSIRRCSMPAGSSSAKAVEVTYLKPRSDGIVEPEQVAAALRADTLLVSLMHVNNEIGVVQDVARGRPAVPRARRAVPRRRGAERRQAAARRAAPMRSTCCRSPRTRCTDRRASARLLRREPRLGLVPLQFGGGQERGLRSGTLPTHQIVGMGAAFRIARVANARRTWRASPRCATQLWNALATVPGVELNGDPERRVSRAS